LVAGKDAFDMLAFETLWWADWAFDLMVGGLLWTYLFVHGARKGKVVGGCSYLRNNPRKWIFALVDY